MLFECGGRSVHSKPSTLWSVFPRRATEAGERARQREREGEKERVPSRRSIASLSTEQKRREKREKKRSREEREEEKKKNREGEGRQQRSTFSVDGRFSLFLPSVCALSLCSASAAAALPQRISVAMRRSPMLGK